jgi:hypothetical protein
MAKKQSNRYKILKNYIFSRNQQLFKSDRAEDISKVNVKGCIVTGMPHRDMTDLLTPHAPILQILRRHQYKGSGM